MTTVFLAISLGAFVSAFGLVFVSELGDKTQLVALGFGARESLSPVIIGVLLAYVATTSLSVLAGAALGSVIDSGIVTVVGGLAFIVFGLLALRTPEPEPDAADATGSVRARSNGAVVRSVAVAMFVAEFGDKTMLATAALAADGPVVEVWFGSLVGISGAGVIGVVAGRALGDRLPERWVRLGSAVVFIAFGVLMLFG